MSSNTILRGAGYALVGFALFSLHDAVIKSIGGLHVFQIVFFVVLFSFVPFAVFIIIDRNERSLRPRFPGMVALRCLFTLVGLSSAFYAFGHLPMTEVYSLLFSTPIIITLLAIPILGERIRLIRWVAIFLGLCGVLVVLRPGYTELSGGHLAALMAALGSACASIVTRKIGAEEHPLTLVVYPMLTNIVVTGIALIFVYLPMSGEQLLKLGVVGVLSVIAQMMLIRAYRTSEAQYVAPMQYSQMLWAILYGTLVFGEVADRYVIAGSLIIIASGLLFIWRELAVSVSRPVLKTRNLRFSGGPQAISSETDSATNPESRD